MFRISEKPKNKLGIGGHVAQNVTDRDVNTVIA